MIQIGDVVVSFDVLREKFICNLDACKGACCVEGDSAVGLRRGLGRCREPEKWKTAT